MNTDTYDAGRSGPLKFVRSGIVLKPNRSLGPFGILNPACARLRDDTLQLYPRMVTKGNVSRVGSFRAAACPDGTLELDFCGFALEPQAPYELRDGPGGYGCEDPRVTFLPSLDKYVMAYVAFGPRASFCVSPVSARTLVLSSAAPPAWASVR